MVLKISFGSGAIIFIFLFPYLPCFPRIFFINVYFIYIHIFSIYFFVLHIYIFIFPFQYIFPAEFIYLCTHMLI